jgi:hypothetical protein
MEENMTRVLPGRVALTAVAVCVLAAPFGVSGQLWSENNRAIGGGATASASVSQNGNAFQVRVSGSYKGKCPISRTLDVSGNTSISLRQGCNVGGIIGDALVTGSIRVYNFRRSGGRVSFQIALNGTAYDETVFGNNRLGGVGYTFNVSATDPQEAARQRQREAQRQEQIRRQQEAQRQEQIRRQQEADRQEQIRRQQEAQRQEQIRRQQEAQRQEQIRRQQEAQRQEQIRRQQEAQRQEQVRRQQEADRQEQIRRQQEAQRQRDLEAQRQREAEAARQPRAAFHTIAAEHNVTRNEQAGMLLTSELTADNLKDRTYRVMAWVQFANGEKVPSVRGGQARASYSNTVPYVNTKWGAFELFIPYDEIEVPAGQHSMRVYMVFTDVTNGADTRLAASEFLTFDLTRSGPVQLR